MMTTSMFHPMLVHFPIALLIVGFLFATIAMFCKCCKKEQCDVSKPSCMERSGYWLLVLGALSALVAVLSGVIFTNPMSGFLGELRTNHMILAFATAAVAVVASVIYSIYIYGKQNKCLRTTAFILYLIAFALVAVTGHYGGMITNAL